MKEKCSSCGRIFSKIGQHWTQSDCDEPTLSDYQKQVITGVMMGDGCIDRRGKNPCLQINMINRAYLKYLDNTLGKLSTGERKVRDATNNRKPVYQLRSRHLDCLKFISEWYESGEKVFPKELDVTPTVLRHWYVCDGSLSTDSPRVSIGIHNERNNLKKIDNYFKEIPEPNVATGSSTYIYWNKDNLSDFFDYIGRTPTEGFLWKWPKYRDCNL